MFYRNKRILIQNLLSLPENTILLLARLFQETNFLTTQGFYVEKKVEKHWLRVNKIEAVGMFDNSYFDNSF
jgi:hypothetical protein